MIGVLWDVTPYSLAVVTILEQCAAVISTTVHSYMTFK